MAEEKQTKQEKARKGVEGGIKIAEGDYIGGGLELLDAFGEDIINAIKTILKAILVILLIFVFLLSFFESLPGMMIAAVTETISENFEEWTISRSCKQLANILDNIGEDSADDICEEIENGYIEDWNKKTKEFWKSGNVTNPVDGSFSINREKSTNNLLAWEYHKDGNADMYTMVRFNDVTGKEANLNMLYLIAAYSVWHQTNDLGSDEDYTEITDKDKRWKEFDTKGLKKFFKKHKDELVKVSYTYSTESVSGKYEVYDSNGNKSEQEIDVPVKVLNVTVSAADADTINNLFEFDDKQKELLDYCLKTSAAIYDSAFDNATSKLNYSFEPTSSILQDVLNLKIKNSSSNSNTGNSGSPMALPSDFGSDVDGSFKTFAYYTAVKSKSSPQYKLLNGSGCYTDPDTGIRMVDGCYCAALGSFYGTTIGTKYHIKLSSGNEFDIILCDQKADKDTDSNHQYAGSEDIIEFYAEKSQIPRKVKNSGNYGSLSQFSGYITSIEKIG